MLRISIQITKKGHGRSRKTNNNKQKQKKWFDFELQMMRSEVQKLGKMLVKEPKNVFLRGKFFVYKKRYKKLAVEKKREYKQNIINNLEDLEKSNPKEYWTLFDNLKNMDNTESIHDNIPDHDWIKHYTTLLGPKNYDYDRTAEIRSKIAKIKECPYFSELDVSITDTEILKAVGSLKRNKAVGIDGISGEMLMCSTPVFIKVYRKLFNAMLNMKYYPHTWKKGIIVNLYKAGDPFCTDNYRGLTINSCLSKVFNTILNVRLDIFLQKHGVIDKAQIGFKKKARTSDHIFVMNTLFHKYSKMRQKLYICFVDFKKAYDSVWREALMLKLLEAGIRGNFFYTIENMYQDSVACIKRNGILSDFFECKTGVRQGDVLSPNLFNIFINDIPKCFMTDSYTPMLGDQPVNCLLYADDLVLLSLSATNLQLQLNNLSVYCRHWGLSINVSKTKAMVLAKNVPRSLEYNFEICGKGIEVVKCYKYLGVELQSNGNITNLCKNLVSRSWKAIFKINSALNDVNIKPSTKLSLFDKLVNPILCYNSEVWGSILCMPKEICDENLFWKRAESLPCEQLHMKFCKNVLGVHGKATNAAVRGELGRYPLALHVVKTMLKYWSHVEDKNNCNPLLKAALMECDTHTDIKSSWMSTLYNLFRLFNITWTSRAPTNDVINKLISNMKRSYCKYWKDCLGNTNNNDGKLWLYRRIKQNFHMENYLDTVRTLKYRRSLTALRISAHRLESETLRYSKVYIPRDERRCALC